MSVPTIVPRLKMVGTAQARAFAHPTQLVELNDSKFSLHSKTLYPQRFSVFRRA
jgi:hypothetical protein